MFDNSVTLTDGTTPRIVTLVPSEGSGTLRRESTSGLITPFTLRLQMQEIGTKNGRYFRHLIRIGEVKEYTVGETDITKDEDVYLVIQRPREETGTDDILWKIAAINSFLTATAGANLIKLLNGEL